MNPYGELVEASKRALEVMDDSGIGMFYLGDYQRLQQAISRIENPRQEPLGDFPTLNEFISESNSGKPNLTVIKGGKS